MPAPQPNLPQSVIHYYSTTAIFKRKINTLPRTSGHNRTKAPRLIRRAHASKFPQQKKVERTHVDDTITQPTNQPNQNKPKQNKPNPTRTDQQNSSIKSTKTLYTKPSA